MGVQGKSFKHVMMRLRHAMVRHRLLSNDQGVLLAFSGGQDSLTLAEALRYLHKNWKWRKLSLAHCDHGWPHDVGIADHVQRYAQRNGMHLHIIDAGDQAVGISEGAAREWRYYELGRLAQHDGYDAVVTAHTRTDLAETVLYNLAHGAGADGLAALSWERRLCDNVNLVRPLLDVSRDETTAFCNEQDLQVWHDYYNDDSRYARNRIRARVMPTLKECVNRQVEEALARTAHLLRDEALYLEHEAEKTYHQVVFSNLTTNDNAQKQKHTDSKGTCDCFVDCDTSGRNAKSQQVSSLPDVKNDIVVAVRRKILAKVSTAIQRRVIRRILRNYLGLSQDGSTFAQVEAVRSLLASKVDSSIPSLCGNTSAVVINDDDIVIRPTKQILSTNVAPIQAQAPRSDVLQIDESDGSKFATQIQKWR